MSEFPDFQEPEDFADGFESVESDIYDDEGYLLDDSDYFDDWGDYGYSEDDAAYWSEEFDEESYWDGDYEDDMPDPDEHFDPTTVVMEIIDIDTVITLDGYVKKLEIRIYADGHQEEVEYFLEDTCEEYWIPF